MVKNDNNKPTISLTNNAQQHFVRILAQDPTAQAIRLGIKISGCSGKSYVLSTCHIPQAQDVVIYSGPVALWVDSAQLPSLQGLEIDCIQDGLNQRIVYNNPNAKGTCGCGESFTDS